MVFSKYNETFQKSIDAYSSSRSMSVGSLGFLKPWWCLRKVENWGFPQVVAPPLQLFWTSTLLGIIKPSFYWKIIIQFNSIHNFY